MGRVNAVSRQPVRRHHPGEELPGALLDRIAEDLLGRPRLQHPALVEETHPIRHLPGEAQGSLVRARNDRPVASHTGAPGRDLAHFDRADRARLGVCGHAAGTGAGGQREGTEHRGGHPAQGRPEGRPHDGRLAVRAGPGPGRGRRGRRRQRQGRQAVPRPADPRDRTARPLPRARRRDRREQGRDPEAGGGREEVRLR